MSRRRSDYVTEAQMRRYLETFHADFQELQAQHISETHRPFLRRAELLPGLVTGYVSTQFGAGFEYFEAPEFRIETHRSSRRGEELFSGAPLSISKLPPLFRIGGANIGFEALTLAGTFPFRLTSAAASVTFRDVGFDVGPWKRIVRYAEIFGERSATFWSELNAKQRVRAEIFVALSQIAAAADQGIAVGRYLAEFKERTVLLLGSFDQPGRSRLATIRASLARHGYLVVQLDGVPDTFHYDLRQKFTTVAAICRFLVVDDSAPSGQLAELALAEQQRLYTVVMRLLGSHSSSLMKGVEVASQFFKEFSYTSSEVDSIVTQAVAWVEPLIKARQEALAELHPPKPRTTP